MLKKGTPASPETALAISVLPVPGGPTISTPLGMRAPKAIIPLAYDSGGVTTSTVTVPLVAALGVTLRLVDVWSKQSTPGLVRLTNLETNKAIRLKGEIYRAENWHVVSKMPC